LNLHDLKTLRLKSSELNSVYTELIRKVSRISLKSEDELIRFNSAFTSTSILPSTQFYFHLNALNARAGLVCEFTEKWSESVLAIEFEISSDRGSLFAEDEINSKTNFIHILRSVARNLSTLHVNFGPSLRGLIGDLPTFPKLQNIILQMGIPDPHFAMELAIRVPNIAKFEIATHTDDELGFLDSAIVPKLPQILSSLSLQNDQVIISLHFQLSFSHLEFIEVLTRTPLPKIVELYICVELDNEQFARCNELLFKWISLHTDSLRTLTLSSTQWFGSFDNMELPRLPALEDLNLLARYHDFKPFHPDPFPMLKNLSIDLQNINQIPNPLPTVKSLSLRPTNYMDANLRQKLVFILPNVEVLCRPWEYAGTSTETFIGLISLAPIFANLVTLDINDSGKNGDQWNAMTGGAERIPSEEILTFNVFEARNKYSKEHDKVLVYSLKDCKCKKIKNYHISYLCKFLII